MYRLRPVRCRVGELESKCIESVFGDILPVIPDPDRDPVGTYGISEVVMCQEAATVCLPFQINGYFLVEQFGFELTSFFILFVDLPLFLVEVPFGRSTFLTEFAMTHPDIGRS